MRRSRPTIGVAAALSALLVLSCTASNPAPPDWRRSLATAQTAAHGAWIIVDLEGGTRVEGELLAVEPKQLWVRRGRHGTALKREAIRRATLVAYTADNGGLLGATTLGTLSTLSHGFILVLSAPLWMLIGGGIARAHSSTGYLDYSAGHGSTAGLSRFRKWARFPQGMPASYLARPTGRAGSGRKPAPRARRGEIDTPCYPNRTCNAGLACDATRATCVRPPELGREGGRCFANQTCHDGLACSEGMCTPAPAPAEDGETP